MQRVKRKPAPRIIDPDTHPERWVTRTVAADFLGFPEDLRALNAFIDDGSLRCEYRGRCRKIHIDELVRFQAWLRRRAASLI